MILFRKDQEKTQELTELERGKGLGSSFFTPVDDKLQCDMDYDHPIMANVRSAEKQQEEERIWTSREDYIPDPSLIQKRADNNRQAGEITSLFDK